VVCTSNWEGEYRKLGLRERERGGVGRGNNTPLKDLIAGAGLGRHCHTPAAVVTSCRWGQNGENTPGHLLQPREIVLGLIVVVR
jgi:hypothetical protein